MIIWPSRSARRTFAHDRTVGPSRASAPETTARPGAPKRNPHRTSRPGGHGPADGSDRRQTDTLRELVDIFIKQTARQLAQIEAAIRDQQAGRSPPRGPQLRRSQRDAGHDAAGDDDARAGTPGHVRRAERRAAGALHMAPREFQDIQKFLATQPGMAATSATVTHHEKNPHHRRRPDCRQRLSQQAGRGRLQGRNRARRRKRPEHHADVQARNHRARPHAAENVRRGRHQRNPQRGGISPRCPSLSFPTLT